MNDTKPGVKRRRGDRIDGRRLRSLDPFYVFTPFIMKDRNDASNLFSDTLELSAAEAYIKRKREEGLKGVGMLHVFIAAYIRCVAQYPGINRFIAGQRIFARNNIEVVMTIKKELTTSAGETSFKAVFAPTDKIEDVYAKLKVEIEKIKNDDGDNGTEQFAAKCAKLPRFVFRAAIALLKWMDYHGLLPQSLLDISPFHGSLVVTDLGSLGIPPVYHHLYNFGNVPVFLAFGAKHKPPYSEGLEQRDDRRYIDYTIVTDERICDGHYFASAFKHMKHYLRHPEILDESITPVEDVD